uniref:Spermidine/spermine N1-acetyltransferase family member 2b n=1 Tax=Neogobius melanostomus TaxID=47308 RepID=A0A8C6SEL9_9GOBI
MNYKIRAARKKTAKILSLLCMCKVQIPPSPLLKLFKMYFPFSFFLFSELERDGFCQNPFFECLVAEVSDEHRSKDGHTVVGYGLYYYTYSTWKGRSVYLEDLYVMPEFRGNGIGKGLMCKVAKVKCVRLQLAVLDWNSPARDFYAAKGAQDLTDSEGWHFIRFDGLSLDNLVKDAPKD